MAMDREGRIPAPVDKPTVLTIAGSDSGGGAGIQADLKTIEAMGGFGTSVITAVTAQNTEGVSASHVLPLETIQSQVEALQSDLDIQAVKTGMLATVEVVEQVIETAQSLQCPLVVDPVMVAASGDRLLTESAETAYEDLIAEATLVTPNADEAAVLTDVTPDDEAGARLAGQRLLAMGADAALVTGGHIPGEELLDLLVTPDSIHPVRHPRVDTNATHGSGCTLSAAIATRRAHGEPLVDAVERSIAFMDRAVRYHHNIGHGPSPVHHLAALRNEAARHDTADAVHDIVERLVDASAQRLVPEVGMNVVGATPYAERTEETAAVEGRITRTMTGIHPNRGIRFGASSHVARFLLAAREFYPDLRFAANCRFDPDVESALDSLNWSVTEFDRSTEPPEVKANDNRTMQWAAHQVFQSNTLPDAVIDRGAVGKEPITKLVTSSPHTLGDRLLMLSEALSESDQVS